MEEKYEINFNERTIESGNIWEEKYKIDFNERKRYIDWKYKSLTPLLKRNKWAWRYMVKIPKNRSMCNAFVDRLDFITNCNYNYSFERVVTISCILENPELPWNWNFVSKNSGITLSDILAHPELPWDWEAFSENPNITLEDILNNPKKPWNWKNISRTLNVKIKDVLKHPQFPWKWGLLSQNPNISLQDILKHPKIPWNYKIVKQREFLWNDDIYRKTLKEDIKTRREKVKALSLFGSLEGLVAKYIGYV
jgi:hypothetical protein